MKLSPEQLLDLAKFSFDHIDGVFFMSLAKKIGLETAWEMDIEAWKQFSCVLGKRIRKDFIPNPVWPDSFQDMLDIFFQVGNTKGRKIMEQSLLIFVMNIRSMLINSI